MARHCLPEAVEKFKNEYKFEAVVRCCGPGGGLLADCAVLIIASDSKSEPASGAPACTAQVIVARGTIPGHRSIIKNMITGTSQSNSGVLTIAYDTGGFEGLKLRPVSPRTARRGSTP